MLVEDTGFVGPVPVVVTTVRLVREAEIQLRRPCLHLILLELRMPMLGNVAENKIFPTISPRSI